MEIDEILADIITNELSIPDERVVIALQNYDAPKDDGLFVTISTDNPKIMSNTNRFDGEVKKEKQAVASSNQFTIEIKSRNREAYERKDEIVMALNSTYSQQQQEKNNIKIFPVILNIVNLSYIEGARGFNRWQIPVIIFGIKTKEKEIEYYDKFYFESKIEQ